MLFWRIEYLDRLGRDVLLRLDDRKDHMNASQDPELAAIATVVAALEPLDNDSKKRVITYAVDRFRLSVATKGTDRILGPDRRTPTDDQDYSDFADFFHAVDAYTEPEQLLVSAYWLDRNGTGEFRAGDLSAPLSDLGHATTRVSHSMEALRLTRPSFLNQVSKSGRNKVWRISDAGRKLVDSWLAGESTPTKGRPRTASAKKSSRNEAGSAETKRKGTALPKIVPGLNLRSSEVESFVDFAGQKNPTSNSQKELVSIYYLREILKTGPIGIDHVFTCFKDRQWRVPADPVNSLQFTASKYRWITTADMSDIGLTTIGLNYVEHDLPKKNTRES